MQGGKVVDKSAFPLPPGKLTTVTWLGMLSIALLGKFRGTGLMLALKRSTAAFALDRHCV